MFNLIVNNIISWLGKKCLAWKDKAQSARDTQADRNLIGDRLSKGRLAQVELQNCLATIV